MLREIRGGALRGVCGGGGVPSCLKNPIAALIVAASQKILGQLADQSGRKKI